MTATATDSPIVAAARSAKASSRALAAARTDDKNAALRALASRLTVHQAAVLAANDADLRAAHDAGLPAPKLARLKLTPASVAQLCTSLEQIAALPDPVHATTHDRTVPTGLRVRKLRAPLGVVCMIYEARPGVTVDAFALCLKAGNACILKGGREANHANALLASLARDSLAAARLPTDAIQQLTTSDRDELKQLLQLREFIDLVIPRGAAPLIEFVSEHSRIPTVQHFRGVCHIYIDARADLDVAERIAITSKASAPATCNAAECLLVHRDIAPAFLPRLDAAAHAAGIELRADERARAMLPGAVPAQPADFGHEFLDLIYAVRIVDSLDDAVAHIHQHSSDHTEAIITRDDRAAERFCRDVQSSCVLVNASTRFNDGFQLGLGAEIGISTSRIHAYGPMGLEQLTCERWVVTGSGQTR